MLKVKVRWQGFTGSPGWSNFYYDTGTDAFTTPEDAPVAAGRVHTFFSAIKSYFPPHVQFAVQNDVEVITEATGELANVLTIPSLAIVSGTATAGKYSAASGAVMTWRTGGVRNGRRVRGRTFLVPMANIALDTDGTLDANVVTGVAGAGLTMAAVDQPVKLGVFARPTAQGAEDGAFHPVTGLSVPDKVAILKSRRD